MSQVLSLILGGGRGTRLYPLTKHRSKPAVPVAGKYRLIDIPISNCINSGIPNVYVLTQFLSASLHAHISQTYKFDMFSRGNVDVLAAQQTNEAADWYQGTADAVRQNLRVVGDQFDQVLILSGDQIYRMNYRPLIKTHCESGADVTIAVLPVARSAVDGFGLVSVDDDGRVTGFVEKPKRDDQLPPFVTGDEWMTRRGIHAPGRPYLASMGIYLFNRQTMIDQLQAPPPNTDFGKDVFPRCVKELKVQAYLFDGYWEDVGTIKSYHEASISLAGDNSPFDFHSPEGVIYTRMRNLPPSWVNGADIRHCLVSDGCVIQSGAKIERTVIGLRSRIGHNARITDTVLIGADRLETDADRDKNRERGVPDLTIGDDVEIAGAILDKDCRIGAGVKILNAGGEPEAEGPYHVVRDGVIVIPRGTVVPPGTVI